MKKVPRVLDRPFRMPLVVTGGPGNRDVIIGSQRRFRMGKMKKTNHTEY